MTQSILVVGSGRCGTSTVARLLHEEFDVCMGKRFRESDEYNKKGYYEDLELKNANQFLIAGQITFEAWFTSVENELLKSWRKDTVWGFKDPRLCTLGGFYLAMISPPRMIIRCKREEKQVAASMVRCYDWPLHDALGIVRQRELMLDNLLVEEKYHPIFFNEPKTDEAVKKEIESILTWSKEDAKRKSRANQTLVV